MIVVYSSRDVVMPGAMQLSVLSSQLQEHARAQRRKAVYVKATVECSIVPSPRLTICGKSAASGGVYVAEAQVFHLGRIVVST